ncbi:multiple organellar RNA editing factor 8, chloroplastic/mitochondrial-like [Magnolia sinica]|uniref:multiple organellar RNA editing factor 8, chloroplastic/mitochondrial-like n=1 Tax=Magnolia sinica TaxID=86752 RepID=UPI0026593E13|nr:multiple organellar RNA editing factor 8, chloroplastic/mitochondrial-like [Magnolia sinica]
MENVVFQLFEFSFGGFFVIGQPGVLWVLPDSYLNVLNKDYGGDLFIDGKVIHRPQFRFNERQQTRNRPRPRYDRRRETMQVERREPLQQRREPGSQPMPMGGQGLSRGEQRDSAPNQGEPHEWTGQPGVLWVLPDSYLNVPNKDYGGDLFVDGEVIHRPQFRFNERQQTRNRPRPWYDRRRETMQVERREPLQQRREPRSQPMPMGGQGLSRGEQRDSAPNQGEPCEVMPDNFGRDTKMD